MTVAFGVIMLVAGVIVTIREFRDSAYHPGVAFCGTAVALLGIDLVTG